MKENEVNNWLKLWAFLNVHPRIDDGDYCRFYKHHDIDFYLYPESRHADDLSKKLIDDHIADRLRREAEREAARQRVRDSKKPRRMVIEDL